MKKTYIMIIVIMLVFTAILVFVINKKPLNKEFSVKLSDCTTANSLNDYMKKKDFQINIDGWPEKWTEELESPLESNFAKAKIFVTQQPLAGGDYGIFPFIKLNNVYCELTDENLKAVFSPIQKKQDALNYYLLIKRDLVSALGASIIYILTEDDYKNSNILHNLDKCGTDYKEKLQNKITEIEEVEDGFLITFVAFNYIYKARFIESRVKIKYDGTIEEISQQTILDCGEGALF